MFLLTLLYHFGKAQDFQVTEANSDCISPIILTDTIYGPTNAPAGYGATNEFNDVLGNSYSFEKEHHSVWFKIISPVNGKLTFDIIPVCIKDDYDFLVYKYSGNETNFCDNIKKKNLKPVRSVISRNDKSIASVTGMKMNAPNDYIHSGPGESFCKFIETKQNEIYYLVLDNVYENGCGFTLKLHYKANPTPEKSLNITLLDSLSHEMINGNIEIIDSLKNNTATSKTNLENPGSYFMKVEKSHIYEITARAKGYFSKTIIYKPIDNSGVENIKISLQKIEKGSKIVLENIYFYGNQDIFLPGSKPSLNGLLKMMKDNPNLKIEVRGHVNWPYNYGEQNDNGWNLTLSTMRAKAVCKYLSDNGVAENRLTFKGFGNTQMAYPYARTEIEMQKNRRVEIVVVSNDE
ncbi:MAG TPA: OmpA family protein [Bacteroidales bacterium]|nr:OmpA family protein [Bacteroidales bacterium]HPS18132.1 OmpA family protein [Bacteroidales bacterium]